ncbi:WAG22 antigen precursor, putative [Trichomonas vaginalis G3]|uniref:receptor protein-tyrosine kinase n=1 Tax=Trichomonas vaginalis (strain ATCC PRA-98 / G3) TaxID=412133 RepID=A2G2F9_TRIV3|nr:glycine-rich protein family [Trichomonas vaginalis G3]EAX88659.1 WAG22 antigen precursor, putative [Trichomonas vaginalis G3]KAI5485801.1 glycine-rich protein family [Trichomonas vaginalis G3]|eukprot:XP_001301589.1 WAG22 antigen precursor [Trichomonas vaginalis G3]
MISLRYDNESKVTVEDAISFSGKAYTLKYPCSTSDCTPYIIWLKPGMYRVERWGASGGFLDNRGAHGSYVSGILPIFTPEIFYLYLGQQGEWSGSSTYNGGGAGTINITNKNNYVSGGSGGGSSDLRLTKGHWKDFNSLKSRIIVAAGGAGDAYYNQIIQGGAGGALKGSDGSIHSEPNYVAGISLSTGGNQTSGGLRTNTTGQNGGFGYGGNCLNKNHGSGGGSGYYGGGSGYYGGGSGGFVGSRVTSGSGGSSYVSGYEGCRAIKKSSTVDSISHEDNSIHYLGIVFYSPLIKDGKTPIPCPDPSSSPTCTETGHYGHGYARITILGQYTPKTLLLCIPWISYSSMAFFILMYSEEK